MFVKPSSEEMLSRWRTLVGGDPKDRWDEAHMAGFFQCFRPTGKGVEAAFDGVELGAEILARLLEVYRVTENSWHPNDVFQYFIIRDPPPVSAAATRRMAQAYVDKLLQMVA